MIDRLQATFRAEATELVSDLERALLEFEKDIRNIESVKEIFRVMHTLKGTASMFGYENLSALTHDLETVYDAIREGHSEASLELLEVTLQSVDHLKIILHDPKLEKPENRDRHQQVLLHIERLLSLPGSQASGTVKSASFTEVSTFYIFFKPEKGIFKNGTNPLYLIDDLASLGKTCVLPHWEEIPELSKLDPELCYMNFEVLLSGDTTIEIIKDVFLFVEDDSEIIIEKISDTDLLSSERFKGLLSNERFPDKPALGLEKIHAIAESVKIQNPLTGNIASNKVESATSIRVSSDKLDELMNLVSELVTSQASLTLLASKHEISELENISENMEKITRRLRDTTFSICLIPIETLVTRFQRLVRDLSKELKKEIEFIAEGSETELDRSIIEKVTDPILHILRNCMDHGIEYPEERLKAGKPRQGSIVLKAYHSGTNVYIQIKDNGKGIDPEKIRQKALSKGLIQEEDILTDKEILQQIFAPGFSTADQVTDVSGRGVGMDIVKRNIESIHGEVLLESTKGEGTSVTLKLPLTLSIMDGMLIRIAASDYILPLTSVDKCFEIETKKLKTDMVQKVVLDGHLVPVFNLRTAFDEEISPAPITQIIKLHYDEYPVGIAVDSIVGEYQAVMKPLGDLYQDQDEFSGATILGDGTVALVVDTGRLVKQLIEKNKSLHI